MLVPKFSVLEGGFWPQDRSRVTTRLVVGAVPTFWRDKFMVTASPGSMTPLVGVQVSVVSANAVALMTGELV